MQYAFMYESLLNLELTSIYEFLVGWLVGWNLHKSKDDFPFILTQIGLTNWALIAWLIVIFKKE